MLQPYLFRDPLQLLTRVLHKLHNIANRDICLTRSNAFLFIFPFHSILLLLNKDGLDVQYKKECIPVFVHVWLSSYMCSPASLRVFCTLSELRSVFTNFKPLSLSLSLSHALALYLSFKNRL